jgi:hypothetical protein
MNPTTKAAVIEALELCGGWVNAYGPDEARDKVRIALSALRSEPEPTPEPGEREAFHELIKLAAWLLSPEPTRQIDRLEDQTHIGHRQFESAQEAMRETLRNKAIDIRKFVDAARAAIVASKGGV